MKKFMRTRHDAPAPLPPLAPLTPPPPLANGHTKTNGHANGGTRRDDRSTLSSRYWSGSASCGGGVGGLWEDVEFPPSLAVGDSRLARGVVWLRPHELCARPSFMGEELNGAPEDPEDFAIRWSVEAGALGSAALCAAAAALAPTPRLLARVAPPQPFRTAYTGCFRFRFWVFGVWREVCVDDRLPTRGGRLLSSRGGRSHDYTLPLLEKAYAKLYGSYAAMRRAGGEGAGGAGAAALQELSGGVVQSFQLRRQPPRAALAVLHSAAPRSTIIVAVPAQEKDKDRCGIAAAHLVTGLARVREGSAAEGAALVRVRSVGRGAGGTLGAGGGAAWRALGAADRDVLAQRGQHPHEHWMSFGEFCTSFISLVLVHVSPDDWLREPALHARRPWRAVLARRRWRPGHNAGGPPSADTTAFNPQFHVQIPPASCADAGGKCHVVVSVTQEYSPRSRRRLRGVGFALYELPPGGGAVSRGPRGLAGLRALDVTHWSRAREVATFFTLPPGEFLLVPHTRRAHQPGAFLLRVLTDQHANIWEVNEDNMIIQSISSEFLEDRDPVPPEMRATLIKLFGKEEIEEVDAEQLRAALRRAWRSALLARPSRELCRALVALRDARVAGRMRAADLPPLLRVLAHWRALFLQHCESAGGRCGARRCSSYALRALLRAAGVAASNKVLECCVVRFAPRAALDLEGYVMTLARLHLAHERFRCIDTKLKSNPLSLEEMILMTIYS